MTRPRFPCFKLALKFDRDDIIGHFMRSGRSGFYSSVVAEGEVTAGDRIEPLDRQTDTPTIADVVRARIREEGEE